MWASLYIHIGTDTHVNYSGVTVESKEVEILICQLF